MTLLKRLIIINQLLRQIILILVVLLKRQITIQKSLKQKIKFLILVVLLKRLITILKFLKQNIKFLIPDTSNLATKTALTIVENKIPDTSNLATKTAKTALNTVENKIYISNLATKIALNTVENKIPDINSLVKKSDYNKEIAGIKLNTNKLQAYDLRYFKDKQYFDEGSGKQNYFMAT